MQKQSKACVSEGLSPSSHRLQPVYRSIPFPPICPRPSPPPPTHPSPVHLQCFRSFFPSRVHPPIQLLSHSTASQASTNELTDLQSLPPPRLTCSLSHLSSPSQALTPHLRPPRPPWTPGTRTRVRAHLTHVSKSESEKQSVTPARRVVCLRDPFTPRRPQSDPVCVCEVASEWSAGSKVSLSIRWGARGTFKASLWILGWKWNFSWKESKVGCFSTYKPLSLAPWGFFLCGLRSEGSEVPLPPERGWERRHRAM